jgi:hypothetical protein
VPSTGSDAVRLRPVESLISREFLIESRVSSAGVQGIDNPLLRGVSGVLLVSGGGAGGPAYDPGLLPGPLCHRRHRTPRDIHPP